MLNIVTTVASSYYLRVTYTLPQLAKNDLLSNKGTNLAQKEFGRGAINLVRHHLAIWLIIGLMLRIDPSEWLLVTAVNTMSRPGWLCRLKFPGTNTLDS